MIKRFIKDNRGQVLYAVLVSIMFIGMLSMIAMGLTLKNYNAALNKQQHVSDYYAADAVAELLRIGMNVEDVEQEWQGVEIDQAPNNDDDAVQYTITYGTVTIITEITTVTENEQTRTIFKSWEVSYHAVETQAE